MSPAAFHLAILRCAALLVPEPQRREWLAEWRSELWHVRRDPCRANVVAFCLGAFRDANWLRRNGPISQFSGVLQLDVPTAPPCIESFPDQGVSMLSSPFWCLSILAGLGAFCFAIGLLLPPVRSVFLCALYPRNLIMLSPAERGDPGVQNGFFDPYPTVSPEQFESLKAQDDGQFTALAFYVPTRMQVETPSGKRNLLVAKTTSDLFRLLNIPVEGGQSCKPSLVVTRTIWRKYFDQDPHRVGSVVDDGLWNLPIGVDAWLIEDRAEFATLNPRVRGFVVARLRSGVLRNSQFNYIRLPDRSLGLFIVLAPMLLFSWILFAIMNGGSVGRPRWIGPRRAIFLVAKSMLVLPIVLFGSLDIVGIGGSVSPLFLEVALFSSFFAARWIAADQQKRCPVCLRLLANPVRLGAASGILLEWNGTELMCLRGHGLLYVPEWPAIWSARERWMQFGPSWGGLFP